MIYKAITKEKKKYSMNMLSKQYKAEEICNPITLT